MLQKLRSRHPIDLPSGAWQHKKGFLAALGGLAALFVIIPLLLSPVAALSADARAAVVAIAAGFGALLLVLIVGTIRGKTGWQR